MIAAMPPCPTGTASCMKRPRCRTINGSMNNKRAYWAMNGSSNISDLSRVSDENIGIFRFGSVTLAYQRVPEPRWPYNLYFMVHGRERAAVGGLGDVQVLIDPETRIVSGTSPGK